MRVFEQLGRYDYRKVVFCNDNASGLKAIIAIHDTTLGPALGGVRMRPYDTEAEAFEDVLRLARGMTYKAAISGVELGGGKSVIIGDPTTQKTEALLGAMGRFVDSLGGEYIAGQDIGTSSEDMVALRVETPFVSCVHDKAGGPGDPSFATAYGVTMGIRAILEAALGSDTLSNRRIAIHGVGHVGYHVAKYCHEGGARLTVADVSGEAATRASTEFGADVVDPREIFAVECDVFSPCSVGAVVNDETIPRLRCKGIAGAANNVLAEPRHADALVGRGIIYAPDYLVNSGGLIRCQAEVLGEVNEEAVLERVSKIYDQTLRVIATADERGISTAEAADRLAEERVSARRRVRRLRRSKASRDRVSTCGSS